MRLPVLMLSSAITAFALATSAIGAPIEAAATPVSAVPAFGSSFADPAACTSLSTYDPSAAIGDRTQLTARLVPRSAALPDYCEVKARVAPSNEILIRLPAATQAPRLLVGGCGGLCGYIDAASTDDALARGYVTSQTDLGHQGPDIAFARDPEKMEDLSWRATHRATVLAKLLIDRVYGKPAAHAYFRGCSTGGRQALTEALMFPDEFDGIIAGSPAIMMAAELAVWNLKANLRADGSSILDTPALSTLHAGALAACDMDDGVRDGVIAAPLRCGFKPVQLLCKPGQAPAGCLTSEQVHAAETIYRGIVTGDGVPLTSTGLAIGSELGWIGMLSSVNGEAPYNLDVFKKYMLRYEGRSGLPTRPQDLDFDKFRVRNNKFGSLPSFGDDPMRLDRFQAAGGKLLMYAGWADQALGPSMTLDFLSAQQKAMGGAARLDPFVRLFMMPGMGHCGGGAGPGDVDFLSALEAWVERGETPERLVAYQPKGDPGHAPVRFPLAKAEIGLSRPLFPFPAYARWDGHGPVDDAASFVAVTPR